jgi:hypothetical protein
MSRNSTSLYTTGSSFTDSSLDEMAEEAHSFRDYGSTVARSGYPEYLFHYLHFFCTIRSNY